MGRDNIAGTTGGILKTLFLIPGKIIQWFMYMGVGSVKGYGKVRQQTRLARTPIMTWVYSFFGWFMIIYFVLAGTGVIPTE